MTFIAWTVLGLTAGLIASKIVSKTGEVLFNDIVLGIIGAVDGGYLFQVSGMSRATGVNFYSNFVAVVGATVVLFIYHALVRRQT